MILKAIVFALVGLVGMMPAAAFAQSMPGGVLSAQPTSDWIVGPVRDGYCSMKASYANGAMIVVMQDDQDRQSIALDIGKADQLLKDHDYPATLTTHPGMSMTAIGRAAEENILILPVDEAGLFLESFRRGDDMHILLRNKDYIFALDGTARAFEALNECSTAFSLGQSFTHVAVPARRPAGVSRRVNVVQQPVKDFLPQRSKPVVQVTWQGGAPVSETDLVLAERLDELEAENLRLRQEKEEIASRLAAMARGWSLRDVAKIAGAHDVVETGLSQLSWKTADDIQGRAQEITWPADVSFDTMVEEFVAQVQAECTGDFAARLDPALDAQGLVVQNGEMACLGEDQETASAVVFAGTQGRFSIVVHQAKAANVMQVLDRRDAVLAAIAHGQ